MTKAEVEKDSSNQKYKKRPSEAPFKQQLLPAWKPVLLDTTVIPIFVILGVFFIGAGIALIIASNNVLEINYDYTNCMSTMDPTRSCADIISSNFSYLNRAVVNGSVFQPCQCVITLPLTQGFNSEKAYFYYGLDRYYQNHRRYVKSRADPQLHGSTLAGTTDCDPLNSFSTVNGTAYYLPAGMVANSLFNDTFVLRDTTNSKLTLNGENIAWTSDVNFMFQNPPELFEICSDPGYSKPPSWPVNLCALGNDTQGGYNPWSPSVFGSSGVGYKNEDLIVWMRTAAAPSFRKLYRHIVSPLPNGNYTVTIDYNYPVTAFSGSKSFIISTSSWIGGKNSFLGIAYLVVGSLLWLSIFLYWIANTCGERFGIKKWRVSDMSTGGTLKWD